jgi:hypothetical protein
MTPNRPMHDDRPAEGESKLALFGAALMVGIGLIVTVTGLVLIVAAVALGDTALVLPE